MAGEVVQLDSHARLMTWRCKFKSCPPEPEPVAGFGPSGQLGALTPKFYSFRFRPWETSGASRTLPGLPAKDPHAQPGEWTFAPFPGQFAQTPSSWAGAVGAWSSASAVQPGFALLRLRTGLRPVAGLVACAPVAQC